MTDTRKRTSGRNGRLGRITQKGRANQPGRPARTGSEHVTPPGANIFLDVGFAPGEAACLRVRALLMIELRRIIADVPKRLAAKNFGVAQSVVTDLVTGRIDLFTIDALVSMLGRVGARVNIRVALSTPTIALIQQHSVPERRADHSSGSALRTAQYRDQDSEMSDT
jgi:predicted XRE-type DNA-binding protein